MTRRLYYEDCHLRQFTAQVLGCEKADRGYWIILDATAFYPEGGGQGCDLGILDTAHVLDVQEQGEDVIHLCDRPFSVGCTVTGSIDWERRFDLMQQHSGEHILSGIICSRYNCSNVGFHVGQDVMEIDFDFPIPAEDIPLLEELANHAIWENFPILATVPDPETLLHTSYRSKRALPWPVRIVQIPGVDSCACCGVHTAFTGEIGLIKILSCVKFHQGVRLELVCGSRAKAYLWKIFDQNKQISQLISAKPLQTADAVQQLMDALAAEKRCSKARKDQLLEVISESYVNHHNVLYFLNEADSGMLRELSDRISAVCSGYAAVFSPWESGFRYCLSSKDTDLRAIGKALTTALQGRGGGKANAQQGTVTASQDQIRSFFQNYIP